MSEQSMGVKSGNGLSRIVSNWKIKGRLIFGFFWVFMVMAAIVGITYDMVGSVKTRIDRIDNLRVPTTFASSKMTENIQASLASLRGWMLTGNPSFKPSALRCGSISIASARPWMRCPKPGPIRRM